MTDAVTHDDELERRVARVLHDHAEIAMSRTDTDGHLLALLAETEPSARRRRLTWGIGSLAAAAAVAITLVLTGVPGLSTDHAESPLPARDRAPVAVATDFVDAFAAHDATRAARDLAPGADVQIWEDADGNSDWQRGLVWAEAVGFTVLPGDCAPEQGDGSRTTVRCPFDLHSIGSDRIGRGPFHDNAFLLVVDDGQIVAAEMVVTPATNGFQTEMWEPFSAWLLREYPADFAVMIREVDGVQAPSFTDDSITRWRHRIVSWLALHQALRTGANSPG